VSEPWLGGLCPWLMEDYRRIAGALDQGHLGHAWLIAGQRGTGKLNLACMLADRILRRSEDTPSPLPADRAAEMLRSRPDEMDHHPDLYFLGPPADKRSISVEQVRDAIAALELTSLTGAGKVLIIEPAEAMTLAAANALLKTLEEPTPSTFFFLVSHQPGFLPATIRSRCQLLSVAVPSTDLSVDWLCSSLADRSRDELTAVLSLASSAPLRALALHEDNFIIINNELEEQFKLISQGKADPQAVADEWLKKDPELLLSWLAVRLEWAIKGRLAPDAWTPVTDLGGDALHNSWQGLTVKCLFQRLQGVRTLLGQLGSGVNLDLALRVLILGFQPGSMEL